MNRPNSLFLFSNIIMRNKLLNSLTALAIAAFAMVIGMPTTGYAQCPTSILPSGCSWAGTNGQIGPVPVPGTSCSVTAQYCYVCCNGINYFYIYAMNPQGPRCNTVDPADMQEAVVAALLVHTSEFGCDPCPNGQTNVSITVPGCWKKNGLQAPWLFEGCIEEGCFCQITATISCVGGVPSVTSCNTIKNGVCNCADNPGASGSWSLGTCYSLECPDPCP